MSESPAWAPLLGAMKDLDRWLGTIPYVVIGGVAASILGRPRATRDIDVLAALDEGEWDGFLSRGAPLGFSGRLSDGLAFARQARVLLARHGPTSVDVDIVFSGLPLEDEIIRRAVSTDIGGVRVPMPTPEDLIIMKAVGQRPRDIADIEGIVAAHAQLDWDRILSWAGRFAETLSTPDILTTLTRIRAISSR